MCGIACRFGGVSCVDAAARAVTKCCGGGAAGRGAWSPQAWSSVFSDALGCARAFFWLSRYCVEHRFVRYRPFYAAPAPRASSM